MQLLLSNSSGTASIYDPNTARTPGAIMCALEVMLEFLMCLYTTCGVASFSLTQISNKANGLLETDSYGRPGT
jgi:hypothetical protein